MARRRKPVAIGPDGMPAPLRWRPAFSWSALAGTAVLAVGLSVLMQQLGLLVLTGRVLVAAVATSLALAVVLPSLGRLVGVLWGNAVLRRARRQP